jgi:hypothetical protein
LLNFCVIRHFLLLFGVFKCNLSFFRYLNLGDP